MTLLDELYDLKSNEPIHITFEKLIEAEFDLDQKIKELKGHDEKDSMSSYQKRKNMLNRLKFEFDCIS